MAATKERPTCAAREPLVYGSRECTKLRDSNSDLCREHMALLWPHQLIRGTFYVGRPESEDA